MRRTAAAKAAAPLNKQCMWPHRGSSLWASISCSASGLLQGDGVREKSVAPKGVARRVPCSCCHSGGLGLLPLHRSKRGDVLRRRRTALVRRTVRTRNRRLLSTEPEAGYNSTS